MRALITGGAGFIGRHFTRHLRDIGWEVDSIDVLHEDPLWTRGMDVAMSVQAFITDHARQARYDLVVHAAAQGAHRKAIDNSPASAVYNAMLDSLMFDWAIHTKQRRFLYLSSSAVYSNDVRHPTLGGRLTAMAGMPFGFVEHMSSQGEAFDAYGTVKRHGERLAYEAIKAGLPVTIVRPFSGYGEDQSTDFPFGAFLDRAIKREDPFIIWGDSRQLRDFVHVEDIVAGSLALIDADITGDPINICTASRVSMADLARLFIAEVERYDPAYRPSIHVDHTAPMGVLNRVGEATRLHTWYTPMITIEEGVRRAVDLKMMRSRNA